jgi:hypothetical protein
MDEGRKTWQSEMDAGGTKGAAAARTVVGLLVRELGPLSAMLHERPERCSPNILRDQLTANSKGQGPTKPKFGYETKKQQTSVIVMVCGVVQRTVFKGARVARCELDLNCQGIVPCKWCAPEKQSQHLPLLGIILKSTQLKHEACCT